MAINITKSSYATPFGDEHRYTIKFSRSKTLVVIVTSNPIVAQTWVEITLSLHRDVLETNTLVAGFGVEWMGDSPVASTFTISVGRRCLIFQLERAQFFPIVLRDFLNSVKLVGIRNNLDAGRLMASRHRIELMRPLLDLSYVAKRRNGTSLVQASYEEIVYECLGYEGVTLRPSVTLSDWNVQVLSNDQVLQSCLDAHLSFLIGKKYRAWAL